MATMMTTTTSTRVPHLIFIARSPALVDAWRRAVGRYFPPLQREQQQQQQQQEQPEQEQEPEQEQGRVEDAGRELFSVRAGRLEDLPAGEIAHECVVSPANAFGIMDGGFDLALSQAFRGPSADMYALTDHVQRHLRARWAGYAPPGSCTLVPLPEAVAGPENRWGTRVLAVVPTMKRPEEVGWNRELVYNAMWALLCEVGRWNAEVEAEAGAEAVVNATGTEGAGTRSGKRTRISRILTTGLGAGAGGVSAERCAAQMVLAVKHYAEAGALPARLRWESEEVERRVREVEETVVL
ncbi:macro domain-like protein [Lentinus tigrinus ALCF2SS1-6]|uniref:Macro domain-like protein n=1 Tax=Lentinus tigrinus ALCF2SS1-6 TaxID=1328759 RepID=A0A5C2SGI0_9APHY|nr:macro domain-like protein [Lentinus tigrinus ALCF2SS1-6]